MISRSAYLFSLVVGLIGCPSCRSETFTDGGSDASFDAAFPFSAPTVVAVADPSTYGVSVFENSSGLELSFSRVPDDLLLWAIPVGPRIITPADLRTDPLIVSDVFSADVRSLNQFDVGPTWLLNRFASSTPSRIVETVGAHRQEILRCRGNIVDVYAAVATSDFLLIVSGQCDNQCNGNSVFVGNDGHIKFLACLSGENSAVSVSAGVVGALLERRIETQRVDSGFQSHEVTRLIAFEPDGGLRASPEVETVGRSPTIIGADRLLFIPAAAGPSQPVAIVPIIEAELDRAHDRWVERRRTDLEAHFQAITHTKSIGASGAVLVGKTHDGGVEIAILRDGQATWPKDHWDLVPAYPTDLFVSAEQLCVTWFEQSESDAAIAGSTLLLCRPRWW